MTPPTAEARPWDDERDACDAPVWLSSNEANRWASGYNAAVEASRRALSAVPDGGLGSSLRDTQSAADAAVVSGHTAGPWEVLRVDDVLAIMPDPITGRPDSFFGIATVQEHDGERSARRVDANARLIAAAPDGLAFAQAYLNEAEASGGWKGDEELFAMAQAFVAKATTGLSDSLGGDFAQQNEPSPTTPAGSE